MEGSGTAKSSDAEAESSKKNSELVSNKCVTKTCTYEGFPQFEGHCKICNETWQIIRHWGKKKRPKKRDPNEPVFTDEEIQDLREGMEYEEEFLCTMPIIFPKTRCDECGKKATIMGFRCRCAGLYCPKHRLPETHNCDFDYRKHGAEQFARENPKIQAKKIDTI